jgi:hypothetical protein
MRDIDHLPPSISKLRIGGAVNLRPLYAFLSWEMTAPRLFNPGKKRNISSHDWLSCVTEWSSDMERQKKDGNTKTIFRIKRNKPEQIIFHRVYSSNTTYIEFY